MLTITVEALAGSTIHNTAEEALTLAKRLGVCVKFKFNGVSCHVHPWGDPQKLADNFLAALDGDHTFKMAFAH
jgi:hypothetical protein